MANEVELCVEVGSNIGDTWLENADINQLCRSCANTHDNMIPIFEGDGLEHDLKNKIDKHFPVNISKDDELPHQMCYQCASTLVAWHDMVTCVIDADKKLKDLLKKSTNKKQVAETVVGSSIVSEDSASNESKSEQKMGSEMEIDNDDNDNDYAPEHDDDDDDEDDDEDNDQEEDDGDDDDEEAEEVVLHKLEAKEKEKTVEVTEKGTTIRDQFMVMNNDTGQMQTVSMSLHRNKHDNILKLSSIFFTSSDSKEKELIIENLVKYVRETYGMVEETFELELEPIDKETGDFLMQDSINIVDNELLSSHLNATENNTQTSTHGLALDVSFYCNKCNTIFKRSEDFETHMKTHKSFIQNSNFGNEENVHSDSSDLFFGSSSILENKNKRSTVRQRSKKSKTVSREPKIVIKTDFHCKLCDKYYKSNQLLAIHSKIHSEKKFICERCGKKFSMRSDFRRHKLTHSVVKPFKCHICPDAFNQRRYLKSHFISKHNMDAGEIAEKLKVFDDVQRAIRASDPDCVRVSGCERGPRTLQKCKECNAQFKYAFDLRRHFLVHHSDERPFKCKVCNASFKLANNLQKHAFCHAEKTLTCETCGKKFSVPGDFKRHLLIHSDLKPIKCPICLKVFYQKRHLRAHLVAKRHHLSPSAAKEIVKNIEIDDAVNTKSNSQKNDTT